MKRRELKKNIKFMTNELLSECLWLKLTQTGVSDDDINNVIDSICIMHDEFVSRLSHVDSTQTRLFFRKMKKDLMSQANDIVAQISSMA